ncbi:anti-virulence regulator CigR family protein [Lacibacterium aquatile]|uniref:Anti-virulence regulator CigR family protein n=1 Tax=Lacibacterium aquatile TaxID=1168082 RepID=A0ABW5DR27_9PROT
MRLTILTLGIAIVLGGTALADPGGKGRHKDNPGKGGGGESGLSLSLDIRFGADEAKIITDYYRSQPAGKPLPPGIAKNLARGKPLPPGIAKRYLPGDLLGRLPHRDDRYLRIVAGRDVLLIEVGSGLILDVLRGVLA